MLPPPSLLPRAVEAKMKAGAEAPGEEAKAAVPMEQEEEEEEEEKQEVEQEGDWVWVQPSQKSIRPTSPRSVRLHASTHNGLESTASTKVRS